MRKSALHLRLHRALREFPRYNQFLDKAHGLDLTLVESHILTEIGGRGSLLVGELIKLIDLDKTAISKLIKNLSQKKIVVSSSDNDDRRWKTLRLTKKGEKLLSVFDQHADRNLHDFSQRARINQRDIAQISNLLTELSNCLKAPQTVQRKSEHPLRPPIRRLTRAFQLLGRRALGSNLNSIEWQILLTLVEQSAPFTPSNLGEILKISKSSTAIALAELEEQNLITRQKTTGDNRSYLISASKNGFNLVSSLEQQAVERFSAFESITLRDVELTEQLIRGAAVFYHLIRNHLSIQEIKNSTQRELARKLTLQSYLSSDHNLPIPSVCFSEHSIGYCLLRDDQIIAAAEFPDNNTLEISNLYYDKSMPLETIRAFICQVILLFNKNTVSVKNSPHAKQFLPSPGQETVLGLIFR